MCVWISFGTFSHFHPVDTHCAVEVVEAASDEQWETRAYRRANTTSGQWSRTRAMPPVAGSRSSHQVTQVTQVTRHTLSPPH